jgi:hypothetical protein
VVSNLFGMVSKLVAAKDSPDPGSMRLYDAATPPLEDGTYRWTVKSELTKGPFDGSLDRLRYFKVEGPRFSLDPSLVAGVFPPRASHGAYSESLPQIVLSRRTLPWERNLAATLSTPKPIPDSNPLTGALPWMALIVLEDGEYTLLDQVRLEDAVPAAVFTRLGSPTGIRCDAVRVDASLLDEVLPSQDELQILAHVRQVNVLDRELNVSRGDGWFSVVIGNRLPAAGQKNRAFLVSLEERTDILATDPPPAGFPNLDLELLLAPTNLVLGRDTPGGSDVAAVAPFVRPSEAASVTGVFRPPVEIFLRPPASLVVLHSWEFTCDPNGGFEALMQALDVGMLGATQKGKPEVSDTGHIKLKLHDRAGQTQMSWYRGPLAPYALTRDPQGPYHSADQARRATPDTGVEDITYAAAFELGRLLAAADGRLAQELMRWRRTAYRTSARDDVIAALVARLPGLDPALAVHLVSALQPALATSLACRIAPHVGPIADVYGLDTAVRAPGFDLARLAAAWALPDQAVAGSILSGDAPVAAPSQGQAAPATLDQAAGDAAGLDRLAGARAQLLDNARRMLGGGG